MIEESLLVNPTPETRCGHFISSEMKKVWNVELKILSEIIRICKKYGIRYMMNGGSLLGAIRHQGFIPWDDDVDVQMLRPDYDKFVAVVGKELGEDFSIQTMSTDPDWPQNVAKVRYNKSSAIDWEQVNLGRKFNQGIFVDVFPLDLIPKDEKKWNLLRKRFYLTQSILQCSTVRGWFGLGLFARTIVSRFLCFVFGRKFFIDWQDSLLRSTRAEDADLYGQVSLDPDGKRFRWPKEWFEEGDIEVPFEKMMVSVPKAAEKMLERTFGDWHKLVKGGALHSGLEFHPEVPYSEILRPKQQFVEQSYSGEYAQNKAHDDVAAVLDRLGFERIKIGRKAPSGVVSKIWERIKWIARCPFWRSRIKKDAVLFVQYTLTCWFGGLAFWLLNEKVKAKKNLKIVALIHDINRSDVHNDCLTPNEKRFFKLCDTILVHTENMRDFFIKHGVSAEKLKIFDMFDYIIDEPMNPLSVENRSEVIVCGNLIKSKCGCLRDLGKIKGVEWKLYGPNFDSSYEAPNVEYMGEYAPTELPTKFKYGYGLIWDGDSADEQSGMMGEYQKINHPHKFSLYVASGLPIIASKNSGIASVIENKGIGFTIDRLADIPAIIKEIDADRYKQMRNNTIGLGNKLRCGDVITSVLKDIVFEDVV